MSLILLCTFVHLQRGLSIPKVKNNPDNEFVALQNLLSYGNVPVAVLALVGSLIVSI